MFILARSLLPENKLLVFVLVINSSDQNGLAELTNASYLDYELDIAREQFHSKNH